MANEAVGKSEHLVGDPYLIDELSIALESVQRFVTAELYVPPPLEKIEKDIAPTVVVPSNEQVTDLLSEYSRPAIANVLFGINPERAQAVATLASRDVVSRKDKEKIITRAAERVMYDTQHGALRYVRSVPATTYKRLFHACVADEASRWKLPITADRGDDLYAILTNTEVHALGSKRLPQRKIQLPAVIQHLPSLSPEMRAAFLLHAFLQIGTLAISQLQRKNSLITQIELAKLRDEIYCSYVVTN